MSGTKPIGSRFRFSSPTGTESQCNCITRVFRATQRKVIDSNKEAGGARATPPPRLPPACWCSPCLLGWTETPVVAGVFWWITKDSEPIQDLTECWKMEPGRQHNCGFLLTLPFFVTLLKLYFLTVSLVFFYSPCALLYNYVYGLLRFFPIKLPRQRSRCSKVVLCGIIAQPCSICTVTIILLFIPLLG